MLVIASLVLDGGHTFKRMGIAAVAYWFFVLMVMIRGERRITELDTRFLKWGYLPLVVVTSILWMVSEKLLMR